MHHIVVMTSTASIGLMSMFVVDLVDMYFLSLLGETELAAAIGYSGTILFFTTAICIGIAIAAGALVSQSLGRDDREKARTYSTNVFIFGFFIAVVTSVLVWIFIPNLLRLLGAHGRSLELADEYLRIIIPSMVLLALAICGSGVLRATGDAKGAMYITVWSGLVNAVLDPILIFSLGMGIKGAAWASVIARLAAMLVALNGVIRTHNLAAKLRISEFIKDIRAIAKIVIPAILTNVATPIGNAYVIAAIAQFGDSAVAGMSIIGRVTPVAFGIVFALSGAVGPIIGQNFGASRMDRVNQTLKNAIVFSSLSVFGVSVILFLLQDLIISGFSATEDAATLISLFCTWIAVTFIFNSTLFVSNAVFNNLGYPHYSTIFNFTKATLGTIPFVYFGAVLGGAPGILIGQSIGTVIVGIGAILLCFYIVKKCGGNDGPISGPRKKSFNIRLPLWPQTNTRG